MSKIIAISDELYEQMQSQAKARGLTVEVYLEQLQNETRRMREAEFRDRMRAKGLLISWPEPVQPPVGFSPIRVTGSSLSQTIIEDRR